MNREIKTEIQPTERLRRMHALFATEGGILTEDYQFFTRQDAATVQSKALRRSAKSHGRQALKPN
jgi:hypothetical protein